jgi:hypothetical protein
MTRSLVLLSLGVACMLGSAWLMYLQTPKTDRATPAWMKTESGEMAASLAWFTLMIIGVALIIKGLP